MEYVAKKDLIKLLKYKSGIDMEMLMKVPTVTKEDMIKEFCNILFTKYLKISGMSLYELSLTELGECLAETIKEMEGELWKS